MGPSHGGSAQSAGPDNSAGCGCRLGRRPAMPAALGFSVLGLALARRRRAREGRRRSQARFAP